MFPIVSSFDYLIGILTKRSGIETYSCAGPTFDYLSFTMQAFCAPTALLFSLYPLHRDYQVDTHTLQMAEDGPLHRWVTGRLILGKYLD